MEETNVTMSTEEMQGEPAAKENETKVEKFIVSAKYPHGQHIKKYYAIIRLSQKLETFTPVILKFLIQYWSRLL